MATNKPTGDNARKGAVKKRTELKNPLTKTSTNWNKGGQFMAVKKSAKKFKAVRREKQLYSRQALLSPLHPTLPWFIFSILFSLRFSSRRNADRRLCSATCSGERSTIL